MGDKQDRLRSLYTSAQEQFYKYGNWREVEGLLEGVTFGFVISAVVTREWSLLGLAVVWSGPAAVAVRFDGDLRRAEDHHHEYLRMARSDHEGLLATEVEIVAGEDAIET